MANTSSLNLPSEWGIDEGALLQELSAMEAYKPKPLPESNSLLEKLHHDVYEAVKFLSDVAAKLDGDFREFERFQKTAKAAGLDWTTEAFLPELTALDLDVRARLDRAYEYLDGPGYLAFQLLRRVGERSSEAQEALTKGLLQPNDREKWLVFLLPELDQTLTDEAHAIVARNVIRAVHACESGKVAKVVRNLAIHFKALEHRIENKIDEAQYLRAGWKSPKQWLDIWKKFGERISLSTFSRRRKLEEGKADRIRCHPVSTAKRVAIHFADLPVNYQTFLMKNLP